jgi:molybdopterin-guanine dinucleotide biosynthesis protein
MPFIRDILCYSSVSVVGLEKNTGKTECLNYILKRLKNSGKQVAVTSIGVDGEEVDSLYHNTKPEITLYDGMTFVTSEKHYRERQLVSEIIDVSTRKTALGRLITARLQNSGKTLLSGPPDTLWLQKIVQTMKERHIDLTLVDGALSRLSLASPAITDAMILTTGASLSENLAKLLQLTLFACKMIALEEVEPCLKQQLEPVEKGIRAIDETGKIHDLNIPSVFGMGERSGEIFKYGNTVFVSGAISDQLLNNLRMQPQSKDMTLIIKDFSKAFLSEDAYKAFVNRGGAIKVLRKTKLIAVCVNPVAPSGRRFDSNELQQKMKEVLNIPVYDVRHLV